MTNRMLVLVATIFMVVSAQRSEAQNLRLEWADHPANSELMDGDAVFQRTLSCWREDRREICKLTVITISRMFCPAVLFSDAFRTDTGDLKVTRVFANAIDLEFTDLSTTWTIHLKLTGGDAPIVEEASGVVVTRAVLPADRIRSSQLVALVRGTPGYPLREFEEVDLKCAKVLVPAAKRAPQ